MTDLRAIGVCEHGQLRDHSCSTGLIEQPYKPSMLQKMLYRYLITGVLNGTMVGIGLSVSVYLSIQSTETGFMAVGLGIAAGLILAGYASFQEIQRTDQALQSRSAQGEFSRLFQVSAEHSRTTRRSLTIASLSPLLGIAVTLFPFTFLNVPLTPFLATIGSVILDISFLFIFGAWLGHATHQRWYISGMRLGTFGILVVVMIVILI